LNATSGSDLATHPQQFMQGIFNLSPELWARALVPAGTVTSDVVNFKVEGMANGDYKLVAMDLAGNFSLLSDDTLTVTGSTAAASDLDVDLLSVADDTSDADGSTVLLTLDINEAVVGDTVEIFVDGNKLMDYQLSLADVTAAAAGTNKELAIDVNAVGVGTTISVDTGTLKAVDIQIAVKHGSYATQLQTEDMTVNYTWS
jgi:hypothetical protein